MNVKVLVGIFLVGLILFSGCTGKPSYSTSSANESESESTVDTTVPEVVTKPLKEITTVELVTASTENWDADAATDGIEITLQPKNKDDESVDVSGFINARLYRGVLNLKTFDYEKGDLLQEWGSVSVGEDYGFLGTKVRLEFDGESLEDPMYLEVDFIYDGKTYSMIRERVLDLG